jgi:hypothetical protein
VLAHHIKKLNNDVLLVDLEGLPPSRRSFFSASVVTIPRGTRGWIKSYCEARSCLVNDFGLGLETCDRTAKLTPARLRCPLCGCQPRRFEFQGRTEEDTRKVESTNGA